MFKRFRKSEKGQGMVEYGLILALVSIVALGSLGGIGGKLNYTFEQVVGVVSGGEVIPEDEALYTNEDIDNLVKNEDYIPISTPDELNNLRKSEAQTFGQGTKWSDTYTSGLGKKYILVSDLDLTKFANFEPIGTGGNTFKGTFDGGGYVISNLTIDRGLSDYAGLFGSVEGASFKNIGLEKVNVTGGSHVGGLVGYQFNSSTVSNSYATGTVNGTGNNIGGLVGCQYNSSTVTNSYATGSVTGTGSQIGGLVGYQYSSSVSDSYATGSVTGTGSYIGGLVGEQYNSSTVSNSYATGAVTGTGNNIGGLVGHQYNSSTTDSYYDTKTTGQVISAGGTGKTTNEMQEQGTYSGWNFESIWTIESGQYPTHR